MSILSMTSSSTHRLRSWFDTAARFLGGRTVVAVPTADEAIEVEAAIPWEAALLDSLPDPAIVVSGTSLAAPTGWRFVRANRRARDVFRILRDNGPLLSVVRDPVVLEAVGASLFGGPADASEHYWVTALEAQWRVLTQPLTSAGSEHYALLMFRDDTDVLRADRTRADFLANASHELRTPLASLLGYIETLRGHAREDPVAREKFLGIMQIQAERMNRLIDDLMSLSRIELNEYVPPAGEADLGQVTSDVLDALSPLARDRGVSLEYHGPQIGEALVLGDRDQLVQVVQNLVDNALKYSVAGGVVSVEVSADKVIAQPATGRLDGRARFWILGPEHAPAQRFVTLQVTNGGAGLAREHLPRLAERFYRVEGQKSGERSGTGLGLAIVKHIINRHHGALMVESTLGEGAMFIAYLPKRPATQSS